MPTAATAAPEPGTPVVVAPGVPSNGRAWELVTPADVVSAAPTGVSALTATGDGVVFNTSGPPAGTASANPLVHYVVATRGAAGWTDAALEPPYPAEQELLGFAAPAAFSSDLSSSAWFGMLPRRNGQTRKESGLLRRGPDGQYTLLAEAGGSAAVLAASADLQRFIFRTEEHLLPADANRVSGSSLYEADGSVLHLVETADDGSLLADCGSVTGASGLSRDGRRAFFSTNECEGRPGRVYLREGGVTTEISASQCDLPECGPVATGEFLAATSSGSSAFLATTEKLTDDDTNEILDLYRYDVAGGDLTLLSSTATGEMGVESPAFYPIKPSPDGSRVIFGGAQSLTAQLADENGLREVQIPGEGFSQWSADGRYVVFVTYDALIGGDSDSARDVYRYDAETDRYTEISVGQGGAGNGNFDARMEPDFAARPLFTHPLRAMSDDGRRVFFGTAEQLVPQDHNEVPDVYEWADGSLGLISDGAGDGGAELLGSSDDGGTVLFKTTTTLLPRDRDGGETDYYVARIGGGFPEAASPEGCVGTCGKAPREGIATATPLSARQLSGGIRLRPLDAATRRRIAASGRLVLLTEVPEPGRLSARASAPVGRRSRTVASAVVEAAEPGPLRLSMQLSKGARRRLAAGHDLRLRLVLRLSSLPTPRRLSFVLESSR